MSILKIWCSQKKPIRCFQFGAPTHQKVFHGFLGPIKKESLNIKFNVRESNLGFNHRQWIDVIRGPVTVLLNTLGQPCLCFPYPTLASVYLPPTTSSGTPGEPGKPRCRQVHIQYFCHFHIQVSISIKYVQGWDFDLKYLNLILICSTMLLAGAV